MRKHIVPALLAMALSASLGFSAHAQEKVLTVGAAIFPQSLQTGQSNFAALSLTEQTNEALVSRDNAGQLSPGLALSWELLDDTTYRFHLRQGVKWTDGVEFTADDVAFTMNRIMDPKNSYGLLARIGQISGAKVVDKYTVDLTTKTVFPTFVRGLSDILIEAKHYYEKVGAEEAGNHPLGTGPFIYGNYVPGDRYELTPNPDYWGGAPKVDKLVIRQIPEAATRIASLLAGETQIIEEVPIDLIPEVEASPKAQVDQIPTTASLVLTFDVRKPPFDNPKVREAFDYAIDKPSILSAILQNKGELLQGQLLTAATLGYNPDVKARPFDPEKAKQLLTEAGYDFSTPIPINIQSGKYVSDVDIANAVAGMLNDIGVKATVNINEGGVWSKMTAAQEMGPIYLIGWYSLNDGDFATTWFTEQGKRSVWINPQYDKLFTEARSTNDEAVRVEKYHEMMQIMHDENPAIFLFGMPSIYAQSKSISGFGASADKVLRLKDVTLN
ncbi:MAG TPA: ABC transporter substrate-binding protein [Devosiaceae bacterium]|jgi:peptide/nickel transport system substrate-binding protein